MRSSTTPVIKTITMLLVRRRRMQPPSLAVVIVSIESNRSLIETVIRSRRPPPDETTIGHMNPRKRPRHNHSRRKCLSASVLSAAFAVVPGCLGPGEGMQIQPGPVGDVRYDEVVDFTGPALEEPWDYHGSSGRALATPHYRLYSTSSDERLLEMMPLFMERSLNLYRTEFGILPAPGLPMDSYLFAERDQWAQYTRSVMGAQAGTYLNISRGGFAVNGVGVFYELGGMDTFKIAAHEGWHQFSQTVFRDSLPDWVEEGIAAYMEGHRICNGAFTFAPWANPDRFFQILRAPRDGALLPLDALLSVDPEDLLARHNDRVLDYYAQVWLLIHYLREWDDGTYRPALSELLSDACSGTLNRAISRRLSPTGLDRHATGRTAAIGVESVSRTGSPGVDVFRAYFNTDLEDADAEYR